MSLFVSQLSFYTIKWIALYDDFTVAEIFAIGCCQLSLFYWSLQDLLFDLLTYSPRVKFTLNHSDKIKEKSEMRIDRQTW